MESGAAKFTQVAIAAYTDEAFKVLGELEISEEKKEVLRSFGKQLMGREV